MFKSLNVVVQLYQIQELQMLQVRDVIDKKIFFNFYIFIAEGFFSSTYMVAYISSPKILDFASQLIAEMIDLLLQLKHYNLHLFMCAEKKSKKEVLPCWINIFIATAQQKLFSIYSFVANVPMN